MCAIQALSKLRLAPLHRVLRPQWCAVLLGFGLVLGYSGVAGGEEKKEEKPKIPPPEEVDLNTHDGVSLTATFYPGTLGKQSVPIIILHEYKGSRADFVPLARALQGKGHAVIVPDLRGHGGSVQVRNATKNLDAATFGPADFQLMVRQDMETIKRFLMEKNNRGELNIEKLCVIGAEMGASVAMEWTLLDWSWPQLPTVKQGRDVRGLVLISPEFTYRGLSAGNLFQHPLARRDVSVLILVGGQRPKSISEAKRIQGMFDRFHPKPEKKEDTDLFYGELKTKLQGAKMVKEPAFKVDQIIEGFIESRLVNQSFPWTDRRSPLEKARQ